MRPQSIEISSTFQSRVNALVDRLGPIEFVVDARWRSFADRLDLDTGISTGATRAAMVVGPPAHVLAHARTATAEFGFVSPVAQHARRWQHAPAWSDNLTLRLWDHDWAPVAVDRVIVGHAEAPLEFVIASARRTPRVVDLSRDRNSPSSR